MGDVVSTCGGTCASETQRRNAEVGKQMSKGKRDQNEQTKVLLLGTGDSGKSTIFKQMKILYGTTRRNSVTPELLQAAVEPCYNSLVNDTKALLAALANKSTDLKGIPDLSAEGVRAFSIINPIKASRLDSAENSLLEEKERAQLPHGGLKPEVKEAIKIAWEEEAVQALWQSERSKVQVSESWEYFAKKCAVEYPEWGSRDWRPTLQEYLYIRVRTTGVLECSFMVEDLMKDPQQIMIDREQLMRQNFNAPTNEPAGPRITVVDVGGQRAERRKWVRVFKGVPIVLYIAALSEYDQVMQEDALQNRLSDSLDVFESIIRNEVFHDSTFILFLNKADLFQSKLVDRKIPLNISQNFPDAPEGHDLDEGLKWMESKFRDIMGQVATNSKLYVHITTATNRENARLVLEGVKKMIVQRYLFTQGH